MSRKRHRGRDRKKVSHHSGFKPRPLTARTENQRTYISMIRDNVVTMSYGPPGTGKTHIAAGCAVKMMQKKTVEKIVICRPVVGVGKDIGYLPGTMEDKVGPYLVPLFDELSYYAERSLLKRWQAENLLEIVPLSMMRGRTFNDCFVILDEAQNASQPELRMLLTRFGTNSKVVLTGDLRQSDLPSDQQGAFEATIQALDGISGVGIVELHQCDIVRHHLIADIESRLPRS